MDDELDEETLNAMLGLSTTSDERNELKKQQRMAEMLMGGATKYNPYIGYGRNSRANIGGFTGALAQGLQGWQAGKMNKANIAAEQNIQGREREGRAKWFRNRFGANRGSGAQTGAAQPTAYYDPAADQPSMTILPLDEENPYGFPTG